MDINTDDPNVARYFIAYQLVQKVAAFDKRHPEEYTSEDALEEAKIIREVFIELTHG